MWQPCPVCSFRHIYAVCSFHTLQLVYVRLLRLLSSNMQRYSAQCRSPRIWLMVFRAATEETRYKVVYVCRCTIPMDLNMLTMILAPWFQNTLSPDISLGASQR